MEINDDDDFVENIISNLVAPKDVWWIVNDCGGAGHIWASFWTRI